LTDAKSYTQAGLNPGAMRRFPFHRAKAAEIPELAFVLMGRPRARHASSYVAAGPRTALLLGSPTPSRTPVPGRHCSEKSHRCLSMLAWTITPNNQRFESDVTVEVLPGADNHIALPSSPSYLLRTTLVSPLSENP
jgi:hypothetical protein